MLNEKNTEDSKIKVDGQAVTRTELENLKENSAGKFKLEKVNEGNGEVEYHKKALLKG